jgi:hypothetical protein
VFQKILKKEAYFGIEEGGFAKAGCDYQKAIGGIE